MTVVSSPAVSKRTMPERRSPAGIGRSSRSRSALDVGRVRLQRRAGDREADRVARQREGLAGAVGHGEAHRQAGALAADARGRGRPEQRRVAHLERHVADAQRPALRPGGQHRRARAARSHRDAAGTLRRLGARGDAGLGGHGTSGLRRLRPRERGPDHEPDREGHHHEGERALAVVRPPGAPQGATCRGGRACTARSAAGS